MGFIFFIMLSLKSFSLIAKETIVITGSSTIAPVMSDIAKKYESLNSAIRIDIQTGGSSRGINDIRNGVAQIGMVSRALKFDEKEFNSTLIARDGLAIIVHSSRQTQELTEKQIKNIFTKKIKDWNSLDEAAQKIVIVNKAEGRSTLELFLNFFQLKNSEIQADIIIGDNEQGIKTVSTNSNAIAYVSIGAAEYNKSVGVPIKLLNFKGVEANVSNVENGKYPLVRELNIITKGEPKKIVKDFIKYVLSRDAQAIIKEHYFVPIKSL